MGIVIICEVFMRLIYACLMGGILLFSCSKPETEQQESIDLKKYESTLDRSDELTRKEKELEEREAQLKQQEDQLNQGGIPSTSTDEYIPPSSGNRNTGGRNLQGDYPHASSQMLTANELRYLSKQDLLLMRNEIFARHGYIFKRDDLYNHFIKKPWYNPRLKDVSHLLSPIEKANIKLIKQFEDL